MTPKTCILAVLGLKNYLVLQIVLTFGYIV